MKRGQDVWTRMRDQAATRAHIGRTLRQTSGRAAALRSMSAISDLKPATMYETPVTAVYPEVIKLAGGTDAIAQYGAGRADAGKLARRCIERGWH